MEDESNNPFLLINYRTHCSYFLVLHVLVFLIFVHIGMSFSLYIEIMFDDNNKSIEIVIFRDFNQGRRMSCLEKSGRRRARLFRSFVSALFSFFSKETCRLLAGCTHINPIRRPTVWLLGREKERKKRSYERRRLSSSFHVIHVSLLDDFESGGMFTISFVSM